MVNGRFQSIKIVRPVIPIVYETPSRNKFNKLKTQLKNRKQEKKKPKIRVKINFITNHDT